jgi:hypothetical protein
MAERSCEPIISCFTPTIKQLRSRTHDIILQSSLRAEIKRDEEEKTGLKEEGLQPTRSGANEFPWIRIDKLDLILQKSIRLTNNATIAAPSPHAE